MSTKPSSTLCIPRPLILIVLDGFGERAEQDDNAIRLAHTPELDALYSRYPHGLLGTSGPDVGLPPGQMGNSEVGHLQLGAGRIAWMDLLRINRAIENQSFTTNPAITSLVEHVKHQGARLHLLGLVSNGGVHSSLEHLFALLELAQKAELNVVVHAFLDGRDTPPTSALRFLAQVETKLPRGSSIGSVAGRYYAMDRDLRWDRVQRAYRAIVLGEGKRFATAQQGVEAAYAAGQTDEFIEPFVVGSYTGIDATRNDAALHVNFRPDRARQLTCALAAPTFEAFDRERPGPAFSHYVCMTTYDSLLSLPVAFPKETYADSFPEVISRLGRTQFRCAETEKYAHVTYFFNGGQEEPFPGEERQLIPSPKDVATYDQKPEMSAAAVAEAVVHAIESERFDFILVNFANPDMVGHTGVLEAAIRAVEAVDTAVGLVVKAVRNRKGAVILTADHGNCERMRDPETAMPHTAHTLNPVPLLYINDNDLHAHVRTQGRLCDVAPTLLALLGIEQPAAMTGCPLLQKEPL